MNETWTDDDRLSLVAQMRGKQREFYSYRNPSDRPPSLLRECKALERQVDKMLAEREGPGPVRDLFGDVT